MSVSAIDEARLREELKQFNWYRTIQLTPNVATPGAPVVVPIVEMSLRALRSMDLRGKRVLDVGCRDGLFSLEAERLGAREVVGFDNSLSPGIPEFLNESLGSKVSFRALNLYDLAPSTIGQFEVVIFPGVLYHLRYPFWALKLIRDVLVDDGVLLLETAVVVDANRHAMMFCPVGPDSPYESTSCTFFNLKGLVDTLDSLGFVVESTDALFKTRHSWWRPLPAKPLIDRCVVVCRKKIQRADAQTTAYWEGDVDGYDPTHWGIPGAPRKS